MTTVESPRPDRAIVAVGFTGAAALAWAWLVPVSLDMYGGMDGPSAWMMQTHWDLRYGALIFLMWTVMMVGMMLPGAIPTILRLASSGESGPRNPAPAGRAYAFGGGYLLVWTVFSLAATVLQWALVKVSLLSPMMEATSPLLAAAILIAAGIYQWTPLKRACLAHCRTSWERPPAEWRVETVRGALGAGLAHGADCLGCCWALMLLLFAGGIMSLAVITAVALVVLTERLLPFGAAMGRLAGVALFATGVWLLLS